MAAALLKSRLAEMGVPAAVRSAGFLSPGVPPAPETVTAMRGHGLDVSLHRSRIAGEADLTASDLVVGLARMHVRLAVAAVPAIWPCCFTLKELIRRGEEAGPRAAGQPLPGWLSRLQQGRSRAALLGDDPDDDVPDPSGGPLRAYTETAAVLDVLTIRLARLCWGSAADRQRRS